MRIIGLISYFKRWKWLWNEWLTTVDHKKIGIMYIIVVLIMFFKGFTDALMMRLQQALAVGESQGFISSEHFQEVFSAHGTTMIFFVAMGVIFGLMNLIVPLQIGARDVAFPFLNALSFLVVCGGRCSYNDFSWQSENFQLQDGWHIHLFQALNIVPVKELIIGYGSCKLPGWEALCLALIFLVTILKMRCPGMTMMKMPIFVWSALCSMILIIFAFPILTATLYMLDFRSLPWHAFFYSRWWGQSHDVCQSHLGLGTS